LSRRNFLGSGSLLGDTDPVSLYIIHGFHVTETNALRISVTEIALKDLPINHIKIHGAERTDRYARTTANTFVLIHHDPAELFVSGNGLHGADDHTGSILTLLAGHGDIEPFCLPFDYFYPASGRIGYAVVKNCADILTKSAAGALFEIYLKNFTHGFHSFSPFKTITACGMVPCLNRAS
jgi:hypothetical protein